MALPDKTMANSLKRQASRPSFSCIHGLAESFNVHSRNERRVLVLYTGGTIGMIKNEQGVYAPKAHEMEKKVKTYPQLHDQAYLKKEFNSFQDNDSIIVFPKTTDSNRIVYFIHEYDPLLDSSNMSINEYKIIATDIRSSYDLFDGFVIMHGTDTLGYTASALSFMFENLGKTVILTGSQIPLAEARSDGRENFLNSIFLAGTYCIPEVTVFFNNKLLRGNRTVKVSTSSLDAFNSPNMNPLVKIGTKVNIDWKSIHRSPNIESFRVHESLNENIALLRIFPTISMKTIRSFLTPPIEGIVLQTYGAGNCPSNRKDLLYELQKASNNGILIVNITQCSAGGVSPNYETGQVLVDVGVIPGSDMTAEAALTKLSYVISKTNWPFEKKRQMLQTNLRGELTISKVMAIQEIDLITAIGKCMKLSTSIEFDALKEILYPSILDSVAKTGDVEKLEILRLTGANLSSQDYDKRTPLHIAVCEGHTDVIEYLLSHGASVHQRDRSNKTPLMNAIECNQHGAIKLLIQAGADFLISPTTLSELLCNAAQKGNVKLLESFHLADADLSQPDSNNVTALHKAVEYNQYDCVKMLLKHNVEIDTEDIFKRTPLDIAKILKLSKIVDLLTTYSRKK